MAKTSAIDVPILDLRWCSVQEHCEALQRLRDLPFWWYQAASKVLGNFSVPFQDAKGHWWYQVKPGLCWPVDCFQPIAPANACPALNKSYLGFQHVVPDEQFANSRLVINAVMNVRAYGPEAIDSKRRNAVRKGLKCCELLVMDKPQADLLDGCRLAWNELTARTGWKHAASPEHFQRSWSLLVGCPGVSIIVGREIETREVAGFLVTKIIGSTAYVDTIASRSDMLHTNVNDAVMYAFVANASRIDAVQYAHYAIKSEVEKLERFKTGIGFTPVPFPARTRFRGPVGLILKTFFANKFRRMTGQFEDQTSPK